MKRQRKELIYHNITSVHKPVIYTYDDNNRLIQIEDLGCYKNSYSGLQLGDWETDYIYDNNGNLLSSDTYSADHSGSYIEYEYNAWGQLTDYSDTLGKIL